MSPSGTILRVNHSGTLLHDCAQLSCMAIHNDDCLNTNARVPPFVPSTDISACFFHCSALCFNAQSTCCISSWSNRHSSAQRCARALEFNHSNRSTIWWRVREGDVANIDVHVPSWTCSRLLLLPVPGAIQIHDSFRLPSPSALFVKASRASSESRGW